MVTQLAFARTLTCVHKGSTHAVRSVKQRQGAANITVMRLTQSSSERSYDTALGSLEAMTEHVHMRDL